MGQRKGEIMSNIDKYETRKKMVYDFMCDDMYVPMKIKELCIVLGVKKEDRPQLEQILLDLQAEGRITLSKRGKYSKSEIKKTVGVFTAHQRGFGFVTVEGEPDDIFIPAEYVNGAMHMDTVEITISSVTTGRRKEGKVVSVIERGMKQVVCTYEASDNFGFAVPDNTRFGTDIFIPKERSKGAMSGHKVVVEITSYGKKGKKPEGKVVEIIGHIDDPGTDILSIVKAYDLPVDFSEKIMHQVQNVAKDVTPADMAGRMDLRDWMMVTIDGEDAKDLDDAITLYEKDGVYKLGVHIADVTHYVKENSPLDKEALNRGTSCYLVDRVIPMLPHKLSNGICSLNEGQDRLALSCLMDIDEKGRITGHKICETVINVDRRMTYTSVSAILEDGDPEETEKYKELVPMFELMLHVSDLLREGRKKRGSIDFDFDESKIKIDSEGKVMSIGVYERRRSNEIIEDFMLAANETIAEDYFWQDIPFEYRVHETPDADRVEQLALLISNFGMYFKASKENIHPKEFQKLLNKIKGEPYENLVSRMALRTMKQAKYSTECTGHFGLSCKYYCHFTSPIRRYPDLQIHRIIKENIHGKLDSGRIEHYSMILDRVCDDNSRKERRAEEAERDVEKLKKVEYMSAHIGEVYDGFVSGVTNRGMFVELPNTVEGFVNVSDMLDDYYYFSQEDYAMIGESTGKTYAIGDTVQIKVKKTDKMTRSIDFGIVYKGEDKFVKGKRKHSHRK